VQHDQNGHGTPDEHHRPPRVQHARARPAPPARSSPHHPGAGDVRCVGRVRRGRGDPQGSPHHHILAGGGHLGGMPAAPGGDVTEDPLVRSAGAAHKARGGLCQAGLAAGTQAHPGTPGQCLPPLRSVSPGQDRAGGCADDQASQRWASSLCSGAWPTRESPAPQRTRDQRSGPLAACRAGGAWGKGSWDVASHTHGLSRSRGVLARSHHACRARCPAHARPEPARPGVPCARPDGVSGSDGVCARDRAAAHKPPGQGLGPVGAAMDADIEPHKAVATWQICWERHGDVLAPQSSPAPDAALVRACLEARGSQVPW
jgi:hypothetical protein